MQEQLYEDEAEGRGQKLPQLAVSFAQTATPGAPTLTGSTDPARHTFRELLDATPRDAVEKGLEHRTPNWRQHRRLPPNGEAPPPRPTYIQPRRDPRAPLHLAVPERQPEAKGSDGIADEDQEHRRLQVAPLKQ
jgi:hypothetical protein